MRERSLYLFASMFQSDNDWSIHTLTDIATMVGMLKLRDSGSPERSMDAIKVTLGI